MIPCRTCDGTGEIAVRAFHMTDVCDVDHYESCPDCNHSDGQAVCEFCSTRTAVMVYEGVPICAECMADEPYVANASPLAQREKELEAENEADAEGARFAGVRPRRRVMSKKILAWHFVGATLRDGSPVPKDGAVLHHKGALLMCKSGLHASRDVLDALSYAPGNTLCRVECGGDIIEGADKLVCTERTILWRIDAEDVLRRFAQRCALDVIHLWDAPDVMVRYLKTGDSALRAAARAAARDAAWAAAGAAAGAAARDAAGAAAWAAARAAAWAAAWAAARAAAGDVARDAYNARARRRLVAMVNAEHRRTGDES